MESDRSHRLGLGFLEPTAVSDRPSIWTRLEIVWEESPVLDSVNAITNQIQWLLLCYSHLWMVTPLVASDYVVFLCA